MTGNAPDDSRVCDEDLEMLADVMLTDTCMYFYNADTRVVPVFRVRFVLFKRLDILRLCAAEQ